MGPTPCYASDIVNRLIQPFDESSCNNAVIASITSAQGRISSVDQNTNQSLNKDGQAAKPTPTNSNNNTNDSTKVDQSKGNAASVPDPIIPGAASGCKKYYTPRPGDSCATVPADFARLKQLNPQLNAGCTNLWAGYAYCIAV